MTHSVQLLGISNAIVDVLAHIEDDFLKEIGAVPGSMTLINKDQAHELYGKMGPATEMSGGSVANTIAGFANLGGSAAYIGKVRADQLGTIFNHDMRSLGVDIRLRASAKGAPTARSHVLITEDGQRTMQTYLGACLELGLADITPTNGRQAESHAAGRVCLGYRRGTGAGQEGRRDRAKQRYGSRPVAFGFILRGTTSRLFRGIRSR